MSTGKSESTSSTGVSRLVRSISNNLIKTTDVSPPSRNTSVPSNETATKNAYVYRIPKHKLTAFELFAQLGKRKQKKPEFPPASWLNGHTELSIDEEAEAVSLAPTSIGNGISLDGNANKEVASEGDVSKAAAVADEVEPLPEPISLARRIQDLIAALPVLSAYSSSTSLSSAKPAAPSATSTAPEDTPTLLPADHTDGQAPPTPPPPAPIADSKLISFLSSGTIMNGSLSKGRQSVWSVLDRLRSPTVKDPVKGSNEHRAEDDEDDDDNSSVMMYAPLQPDDRSEVEIARSEICSVDEQGDVISERPGDDINKPESSQKGTDNVGRGHSSGNAKGGGKVPEEMKKVKEVRVWVPSSEKISVQATWWGYRL
jgi:hypothetical protein